MNIKNEETLSRSMKKGVIISLLYGFLTTILVNISIKIT